MSNHGVKIKNNGYTCCACGKRVVFSPSLKERGMTKAQAQCCFVDAKGGMCVDCCVEKRSRQASELMARTASTLNSGVVIRSFSRAP